jgi:Bacterial Ig-like domain (group 3)
MKRKLAAALTLALALCVTLGAPNPVRATTTSSFTTDGENTFTVPAGVRSIHVVADGAAGGNTLGGVGGAGAEVTADITVTPGSTLYIEVNVGGGGADNVPGLGQFGGGAGTVQTCSNGSGACSATYGTGSDPRLVVAGGGGGAGAAGSGGSGGAGGQGAGVSCVAGGDGTDANTSGGSLNNGGGGLGGTCVAGGAGGAAGVNPPNPAGSPGLAGSAASGGSGSSSGHGGGGGGGGYFGGGGGGGDSNTPPGNGGGGGGGSSFGPSNAVFGAAASASSAITLSYPTATTTTLTSAATTSTPNSSVQFTATISPTPDGGTVTFVKNQAALAYCLNVPVVSGKASCNVNFFGEGSYTVLALYNGDSNFLASTSARLPIVIAAAPVPVPATGGA